MRGIAMLLTELFVSIQIAGLALVSLIGIVMLWRLWVSGRDVYTPRGFVPQSVAADKA
jgi:hypothetical protein